MWIVLCQLDLSGAAVKVKEMRSRVVLFCALFQSSNCFESRRRHAESSPVTLSHSWGDDQRVARDVGKSESTDTYHSTELKAHPSYHHILWHCIAWMMWRVMCAVCCHLFYYYSIRNNTVTAHPVSCILYISAAVFPVAVLSSKLSYRCGSIIQTHGIFLLQDRNIITSIWMTYVSSYYNVDCYIQWPSLVGQMKYMVSHNLTNLRLTWLIIRCLSLEHCTVPQQAESWCWFFCSREGCEQDLTGQRKSLEHRVWEFSNQIEKKESFLL